jgi:hypothetical protein
VIELETRVNQTEAIAALSYARGVSLIHFSLIVAWFYVIHPDIEYANTLDMIDAVRPNGLCVQFAKEVQSNLYWQLGNHIFCMITCFWLELFETSLVMSGLVLRTFDILSLLMNFLNNIISWCLLFRFYGLQKEASRHQDTNSCFKEENMIATFGNSINWLTVEFIVYWVFLVTLLNQLIKSAIGMKVQTDQRH